MEYRYLGKSGLQLSTLSFGSWVTFAKQIGDNMADTLMESPMTTELIFLIMRKYTQPAKRTANGPGAEKKELGPHFVCT